MSEVTASAERERSSRVLQGGRVVLMSGTYRFLYTYNTSDCLRPPRDLLLRGQVKEPGRGSVVFLRE